MDATVEFQRAAVVLESTESHRNRGGDAVGSVGSMMDNAGQQREQNGSRKLSGGLRESTVHGRREGSRGGARWAGWRRGIIVLLEVMSGLRGGEWREG